ncbi:MAG TPA: hypothetical protein VK892_06955 [Pyrinomonadaceae bacterium]|nr:hypothetical protein [Pyrinomonadaceae bacterium]
MEKAKAQHESINTVTSWLKELSGIGLGIVAVLYVCGYLVHTIYYRLLGVDVGAQPLNYLTFSGDYLVSIFISVPQLFSMFSEYCSYLFEKCLWLSILLCLMNLICILALKRYWFDNWKLKLAICLLIAFAAIPITLAEINILKIQNVLQPFLPPEIQGAGEQTNHEKLQLLNARIELVRTSYKEHHTKQGISVPGFEEWKRWFSPLTSNNELERIRFYLALLQVNIVFLITLIVTFWARGTGRFSKIIIVEVIIGLTLILLLFPCIYATLGRVFLFPVVTLELKTEKSKDSNKPTNNQLVAEKGVIKENDKEQKVIETHPLFLIFQDESEIIVYDRINLFQLKRLPRSEVLKIKQLYKSSPFRNCQLDEDDFIPCETLWIKEETPILNF